jgi:hypothetical protein
MRLEGQQPVTTAAATTLAIRTGLGTSVGQVSAIFANSGSRHAVGVESTVDPAHVAPHNHPLHWVRHALVGERHPTDVRFDHHRAGASYRHILRGPQLTMGQFGG